MNRKKLGIIASALVLLVVMLWLMQGYDEVAQAAALAKGTSTAASSMTASAAPSAATGKTAIGNSSTLTLTITQNPQPNARHRLSTSERQVSLAG